MTRGSTFRCHSCQLEKFVGDGEFGEPAGPPDAWVQVKRPKLVLGYGVVWHRVRVYCSPACLIQGEV